MNDVGQFCGEYFDSEGSEHGFIGYVENGHEEKIKQ
jgi:hypothetical protein